MKQSCPTWIWQVSALKVISSLGRKQFSVIIFSLWFSLLFLPRSKLVPSLLSTVNFSPERLLTSFAKQFRFLFVVSSIFMLQPRGPTLLTEMGLSNQFCQTKDFWVFLRKQKKKLHSLELLITFYVLLSLSSHNFNSYLGLFRKCWFLVNHASAPHIRCQFFSGNEHVSSFLHRCL